MNQKLQSQTNPFSLGLQQQDITSAHDNIQKKCTQQEKQQFKNKRNLTVQNQSTYQLVQHKNQHIKDQFQKQTGKQHANITVKKFKQKFFFKNNNFRFPPPPPPPQSKLTPHKNGIVESQKKYEYQKKYFSDLKSSSSKNTASKQFKTKQQLIKQPGVLYIQNIHSGMLKQNYFEMAFNEYGNIIDLKLNQKKNQAQITFQNKESVQTIIKKNICLFNRSYILLGKNKKHKIIQELLQRRKKQQNYQQKQQEQKLKQFQLQAQAELKRKLRQIASQQLRSLYFIQKMLPNDKQVLDQVQEQINEIGTFLKAISNQKTQVKQKQYQQKIENKLDWRLRLQFKTNFQTNKTDIQNCFGLVGSISQVSFQSSLQLLDDKRQKHQQIQLLSNLKKRLNKINSAPQINTIELSESQSQSSNTNLQQPSLPVQTCHSDSISSFSQTITDSKISSNKSFNTQLPIIHKSRENSTHQTIIFPCYMNQIINVKYNCPKHAYQLYEQFRILQVQRKDFKYEIQGQKLRQYFLKISEQTLQKLQKPSLGLHMSNIISQNLEKQVQKQVKSKCEIQNIQQQRNFHEQNNLRSQDNIKQNKEKKMSYVFLQEEDQKYKQINSILQFWDQSSKSQNQIGTQIENPKPIENLESEIKEQQQLNSSCSEKQQLNQLKQQKQPMKDSMAETKNEQLQQGNMNEDNYRNHGIYKPDFQKTNGTKLERISKWCESRGKYSDSKHKRYTKPQFNFQEQFDY